MKFLDKSSIGVSLSFLFSIGFLEFGYALTPIQATASYPNAVTPKVVVNPTSGQNLKIDVHQELLAEYLETNDFFSAEDFRKRLTNEKDADWFGELPRPVQINYAGQSQYFDNLMPGETYTWEGGTLTVAPIIPRTLALPTTSRGNDFVQNVRDAGGWPLIGGQGRRTNLGVLYRGAKLDSYSDQAQLNKMREWFGIQAEIDLRYNSGEGVQNTTMSPFCEGVKYEHAGFGYRNQESSYLFFAKYTQNYKKILEVLAANEIIYYHCTRGCDRTEVMTFVLDVLCGVEPEAIYRDYLISNFSPATKSDPLKGDQLDFMFSWFLSGGGNKGEVVSLDAVPAPSMSLSSNYGVSAAGYMRAYLQEECGVSYETIAKVTRLLTGETPEEVLERVDAYEQGFRTVWYYTNEGQHVNVIRREAPNAVPFGGYIRDLTPKTGYHFCWGDQQQRADGRWVRYLEEVTDDSSDGTWQGTDELDWSETSNWELGLVPNVNGYAKFKAGDWSVTLTENHENAAKGLSLAAGANVAVVGDYRLSTYSTAETPNVLLGTDAVLTFVGTQFEAVNAVPQTLSANSYLLACDGADVTLDKVKLVNSGAFLAASGLRTRLTLGLSNALGATIQADNAEIVFTDSVMMPKESLLTLTGENPIVRSQNDFSLESGATLQVCPTPEWSAEEARLQLSRATISAGATLEVDCSAILEAAGGTYISALVFADGYRAKGIPTVAKMNDALNQCTCSLAYEGDVLKLTIVSTASPTAADYVWRGDVPRGVWPVAENWSPNNGWPRLQTDTATINVAATIDLAQRAYRVDSLTLGAAATISNGRLILNRVEQSAQTEFVTWHDMTLSGNSAEALYTHSYENATSVFSGSCALADSLSFQLNQSAVWRVEAGELRLDQPVAFGSASDAKWTLMLDNAQMRAVSFEPKEEQALILHLKLGDLTPPREPLLSFSGNLILNSGSILTLDATGAQQGIYELVTASSIDGNYRLINSLLTLGNVIFPDGSVAEKESQNNQIVSSNGKWICTIYDVGNSLSVRLEPHDETPSGTYTWTMISMTTRWGGNNWNYAGPGGRGTILYPHQEGDCARFEESVAHGNVVSLEDEVGGEGYLVSVVTNEAVSEVELKNGRLALERVVNGGTGQTLRLTDVTLEGIPNREAFICNRNGLSVSDSYAANNTIILTRSVLADVDYVHAAEGNVLRITEGVTTFFKGGLVLSSAVGEPLTVEVDNGQLVCDSVQRLAPETTDGALDLKVRLDDRNADGSSRAAIWVKGVFAVDTSSILTVDARAKTAGGVYPILMAEQATPEQMRALFNSVTRAGGLILPGSTGATKTAGATGTIKEWTYQFVLENQTITLILTRESTATGHYKWKSTYSAGEWNRSTYWSGVTDGTYPHFAKDSATFNADATVDLMGGDYTLAAITNNAAKAVTFQNGALRFMEFFIEPAQALTTFDSVVLYGLKPSFAPAWPDSAKLSGGRGSVWNRAILDSSGNRNWLNASTNKFVGNCGITNLVFVLGREGLTLFFQDGVTRSDSPFIFYDTYAGSACDTKYYTAHLIADNARYEGVSFKGNEKADAVAIEVILGMNNEPEGSAVFSFSGDFDVNAHSSLMIDATRVSPGVYSIIKADKLTDNVGLVNQAVLRVADGSEGSLSLDNNELVLTLTHSDNPPIPSTTLKFGVMSDLHLGAENRTAGDVRFRAALNYFKNQGVDAIIFTGDLANNEESQNEPTLATSVASAFFDVFGVSTSVKPFCVLGNHDPTVDYSAGRKAVMSAFKMTYDETKPYWTDSVKGYTFVGVHWNTNADYTASALAAAGLTSAATQDKPFFCFEHAASAHTVYEGFSSYLWQQPEPTNGVTFDIARAIRNSGHASQAFVISGHDHYSITDERAIWQGDFTAIASGSFWASIDYWNYEPYYYLGLYGSTDWYRLSCAPEGFTNDLGIDRSRNVGQKKGQQALLYTVTDSAVAVRRLDFHTCSTLQSEPASLGSDWVVPLGPTGEADLSPYVPETHRASRIAPQFDSSAIVTIEGMRVSYPQARAQISSKGEICRVMGYEIRVLFDDEVVSTNYVLDTQYNCSETVGELQTVKLNGVDLGGHALADCTVEVIPLDSFALRGRTIRYSPTKPVDPENPDEPTTITTNALANAAWGYEIHGLGDAGDEVVLVYTNSAANMSWTVPTGLLSVQYLLVGGGGAGASVSAASSASGGGAGGEVVLGTQAVTAGSTLTIQVGAGGAAAMSNSESAQAGKNSCLDTLVAKGGAAGEISSSRYAKGGAGANGAGVMATATQPGDGGDGRLVNLVGASYYYGAGGGAGGGVLNPDNQNQGKNARPRLWGRGGRSGAGLDGNASGDGGYYTSSSNPSYNYAAVAGEDGFGGGGGGAMNNKPTPVFVAGARGGAGIVILRYTIPSVCDHIWTTNETAATCTAAGERVRTCSRCQTTERETFAALGHDMGAWQVITPAKVGVAGVERWDCRQCDYFEEREIPALPDICEVTTNAMANANWGYVIGGLPDDSIVYVYTNQYQDAMTFRVPDGVDSVQLLLVGGGGAGGSSNAGSAGGGGGAGGVRYESSVLVTSGSTISVKVGKGGASVSGDNQTGGNGGPSSFGSAYSVDGGGGGAHCLGTPGDGGSGGGSSKSTIPGSATNPLYGNSGGVDTYNAPYNAAGGGGAGSAGQSPNAGGTISGGAGGDGKAYDITGTSVIYGGGGGGGACANKSDYVGVEGGAGGLGGGGAGCKGCYYTGSDEVSATGEKGVDGLGGGGGGARAAASGAGGSGVVIVRYRVGCVHEVANWIEQIAADCETDGYETGVCSLCGETVQRPIPATGHAYGEWETNAIPACLEAGERQCLCGHANCPTPLITETLKALGHSPDKRPARAPTQAKRGLTEGEKCARCGATLKAQEFIPRLPKPVSTNALKDASWGYCIENLGDGHDECAFVFTNNHATTMSFTLPAEAQDVRLLLVGGGGGGGFGLGGGGGAGRFYEVTAASLMAGETYRVQVGSGGAGGRDVASSYLGATGSDSKILTLAGDLVSDYVAVGGGGGGTGKNETLIPPAGGSGGGGGGWISNNLQGWITPGSAVTGTGDGHKGYWGYSYGSNGWNGQAGGGGGAGEGGGAQAIHQEGGAGKSTILTGESWLLAGGGGGGANQNTLGGAGQAGGGAGGANGVPGLAAGSNTGSGGGGGGGGAAGGAGGSGLVIVRYRAMEPTVQNYEVKQDKNIVATLAIDNDWIIACPTVGESQTGLLDPTDDEDRTTIAENLNQPTKHGFMPWQSYVLGYEPADVTQAAMVMLPAVLDKPTTGTESVLAVTLANQPVKMRTNEVEVAYQLMASDKPTALYNQVGEESAVPIFEIPEPDKQTTVKYFRIGIKWRARELPAQ